MLRLVALTAQASLLLLVAYNATTALWGWRDRRPAEPSSRGRRLRVVIPAHNEASVIGSLLKDLSEVDYPATDYEIWVIADRCTDETAPISRRMGARVAERTVGLAGKGSAISWYLRDHPLGPGEVLVVFDADNRVPKETLRRIRDEIEAGSEVLQCYLDVVDVTGSALTEAAALSYWASNRMVQLARSNLGWSADLGGTGMALTERALHDVGGFGESLTEDQEMGIKAHLAGHRVEWLHDVRVRDEKPLTLGVAIRQRARWMAGKRSLRRKYLFALLGDRSPASVDLAVRLLQPGRTFVALVSGVLLAASAATQSPWLLSWWIWAAATGVQVLQPIPFLAKEGVEPRRLARYPLLILVAALWLPVRFLSTRVSGWYHTPHEGSSN